MRVVAGGSVDVEMESLLDAVFPADVAYHHVTHTFDVFHEASGAVSCLLQVQYEEPTLGGAMVNSIVKLDVASGALVPTVDGDLYWSVATKLGTESLSFNDTIYKLQYFRSGRQEQWHGNGVHRFVDTAGRAIVALTHRNFQEAFLVLDPWTYAAADGADAILQRFGTSPFTGDETATLHHFGLPTTAKQWTGGVHNVWYTPSSATTKLAGKETLTLFVNSIEGWPASFVFEFEVKLSPELPFAPLAVSVFDADFVFAECFFKAQAMGGARVIGDGVYLVASGAGNGGLVRFHSRDGSPFSLCS